MGETFRAEREGLEALWAQGVTGKALLASHSRLADEFIGECFRAAKIDGLEDSVALVALGGYGRQELFPFSDIDLMILYSPKLKNRVQEVADAVLYPLWDTGLEIGHGVRTVKQALKHAEEEYFFQVAMLDARLIDGSPDLYGQLLRKYRDRFVNGRREVFVEKMKEHRDQRRTRFGSHSYLLEPHIKEGKGGMRDIQAMLWTAKMVFGLNGLDDIAAAGLLVDEEYAGFLAAWDALVQLRNRLHYISRRKNDQLFFELQEEVAEALGYTERDGVLGVEQFMRDTYARMENIAVVTDLFFDHVEEVLGLARKSPGVAQDREIEKGIEVRNGRVQLTALPAQLEAKPHLLMRLFLASARTGAPVHHRTRKAISSSLGLVSDKMRNSPRMARVLCSILLEAKDVFEVLEVMLETGLLSAYIPEFSRIVTLAQHDIYHIYTVDRHSLQTVAELRKVVQEHEEVYGAVELRHILFLAALMHDIGKGSGRDHSVEGAEVAVRVATRMGMAEQEAECLSFLIRYHLFVPENALRRDLNDMAFIQRCAEIIGDLQHLAMLYLLSMADSRATGPSAWSEWKAALMQELYLKVRAYLEVPTDAIEDTEVLDEQVEQGAEWLRRQVRQQLAGDMDGLVDVESLPADYVLTFSPETVARHMRLHRQHYRLLRQKSLVVAEGGEESWSVLVMSTDRPGLLAKICGVLALHNLTVVKAQIFTWEDSTAVDVLAVTPTDGLGFAERDWSALNSDLDLALAHRLGLGHRLYQKLSTTYGRRELVGKMEPRVVIDNDSSDVFSVVEVYAADRPGMLYHITQTLADFGINIHKAYIATEVEQLIDVFYVLDGRGRKLVDKDFQQEITGGLLYALGQTKK